MKPHVVVDLMPPLVWEEIVQGKIPNEVYSRSETDGTGRALRARSNGAVVTYKRGENTRRTRAPMKYGLYHYFDIEWGNFDHWSAVDGTMPYEQAQEEGHLPTVLLKCLGKNGHASLRNYFQYSLPTQRKNGIWTPGKWTDILDHVGCCHRGYHAATLWGLSRWMTPNIWRVQVGGAYDLHDGHDKMAFGKMRITEPVANAHRLKGWLIAQLAAARDNNSITQFYYDSFLHNLEHGASLNQVYANFLNDLLPDEIRKPLEIEHARALLDLLGLEPDPHFLRREARAKDLLTR